MKALVEFVGAGPGAEDLITVRGLRALEQADLVVYAGSLVNPAHLKACKADCTCLDSASMNLGEQIEAMSDAALTGKRVVRLHTGDPAMYGAINEQIRGLAQKGVAASIIPGVSSVFAAAAALGCELTSPDVSQSVVLTRTPGRTPMPQGEDAAAFARTGAMLVFFLSTGKVGELMRHLMEQGGLAEDTPAAIVYRASWPDERILRGTVDDIARQAEEAGLGRQALVIVGRALGANGTASRLYDADFSHGYRNRLVSEDFDGRCALYAFTDKGLTRAREIAAGLGLPTVLHSTRPSNAEGIAHIPAQDFDSRLAANWAQFDAHIFIGATGIPFRKATPLLRGKNIDPAVLACPESGSHVIALTSGHFGGTNRLARRIARITGGQAVIGSPADVNGLPAFDEAAAQEHARILNPEAVRALNAALLDGSPIAFCGTRAVFERHFASTGQVAFFENPQDVTCGHAVLWDSENTLPEEVLYLDVSSRAFVLGVGCRRGVKPQELRLVAERYLSEFGLNAENIAGYFAAGNTARVELILTNRPDAKVLRRAEKLQIESVVFDRDTFYNSDRIVGLMRRRQIDYVVLAGFLWLVPENLLTAYPNRIVNIHPALLPRHGGKGMYGDRVHRAVVEAGDRETGITIHRVNERYDSGDILAQYRVPVTETDTSETVAAKVHALEYEHFPAEIEKEIARL